MGQAWRQGYDCRWTLTCQESDNARALTMLLVLYQNMTRRLNMSAPPGKAGA